MILNKEYFVSKYENENVYELRVELSRILPMLHDLRDYDYQSFNTERVNVLRDLINKKHKEEVDKKIGDHKISDHLSIKIYTDGVAVRIFDTSTFLDMEEARKLTKKINDAIIVLQDTKNV